MLIAGVDEVGRGAWAGPIVAAAVIFDKDIPAGITDSKKLSVKTRQKLDQIIRQSALSFAIAEVSSSEIDRVGIAEANRNVLKLAINNLIIRPDIVRIDGFSCGTDITEEVYIKGDSLFPEIGAASIIAKVYRDNLMHNLHFKYPEYRFDKHVGYGTSLHSQMLEIHGPCKYHRMSFAPMKFMSKP